MLQEKGDPDVLGVRVSVKKRGCNGYSYQMNYATSADLDKKKSEIVESHGVRVFVDTKAIFFIVGTTMDVRFTYRFPSPHPQHAWPTLTRLSPPTSTNQSGLKQT